MPGGTLNKLRLRIDLCFIHHIVDATIRLCNKQSRKPNLSHQWACQGRWHEEGPHSATKAWRCDAGFMAGCRPWLGCFLGASKELRKLCTFQCALIKTRKRHDWTSLVGQDPVTPLANLNPLPSPPSMRNILTRPGSTRTLVAACAWNACRLTKQASALFAT